MDCLIISGMSGAGKSLAADVLEDIGYYCVDNMPIPLISKFVELFMDSSERYKRVAFVIDARSEGDFDRVFAIMDGLRLSGINANILFLDCSDEKLLTRYKETRRRHPLDVDGKGIIQALKDERRMLETLQTRADYLIDTTSMPAAQLRNHLTKLFCEDGGKGMMVISVCSFGFKYGIPRESDMVFDVRFIDNPFYVPELKEKSGLDDEVYNYVFRTDAANDFAKKLFDMIDSLIPRYIEEGKTSLVISVGCTGGRHRSVSVARRLFDDLNTRGHNVVIRHRDLHRG